MTLLEKRWPSERYGELATRIVAEGGRVVVVGGPADRQIGAAMMREAHGGAILDVTGRLSLGATAAVIEACDAFVGNDSGIAHLAAAVGTPVVVIFGPTDSVRYGPAPGAGVAVTADGVVRSRHESDSLRSLSGSSAIRNVSIESVWSALAAILAERVEGGPGTGV